MASRRLVSFGRDRAGFAAVEFALILPVLILFSMGLAEVGRFVLLSLKLQHAATTMADLAARDEQLTLAAVQSMFSATQHITRPFNMADDGVVVISSVGVVGNAPATVFWQQRGSGKLATASSIGLAGANATLPGGFTLRDGETVIVAEALFHYRPWLMRLVPEANLRRVAFFRPRLGALRSLS